MDLNRERITFKQKRLILGCAMVAYAVLVLLLAWRVGVPLVRFVQEPERFRAWLDNKGIWGRLSFVGIIVLQVVSVVIPSEPLEIGAGYAFGGFEGTMLCVLGATIGGVLVFAFVRRFGVRLVEVFFTGEKIRSLLFLRDSPKRRILMWLLFLIPGTPKALLCYFAGLTDMKWPEWLIMTSLGRLPNIVASTVGGGALGVQAYMPALIIFAVTIAVSLVGIGVYKLVCRINKTE